MGRSRKPRLLSPMLDDDIVELLATAIAPIDLDPVREDALLSRILSEAGLAPPLVQTIRLDEGQWRPLASGVAIKILSYDQASHVVSFLARYTPGSEVGQHYHLQTEECLLISGDLTVDQTKMSPGDFQIVRPGARHGKLRSEHGALVFVRGHLNNPV
jgi:anti-sigma factor ChrR (cupin superfamily)